MNDRFTVGWIGPRLASETPARYLILEIQNTITKADGVIMKIL